MATFEIKHRWTGAVLWSGEADSLRDAVEKATAARANLADADLAGANLADARNVPEGITAITPADAHPRKPYERKVRTRQERAADYRARHPDVPVVPNLDSLILGAIESGGGSLDMGAWHSCETTHCRAGWAIHLAGEKGYALEREHYAERAGRMIYLASTGRAPYFFDTNARALADIRRCAAEEQAEST